MKKVYLEYEDWKLILFGETGLPLSEIELLEFAKSMALREDILVILTENKIPTFVLKYDLNTGIFLEHPISE